MLYYDHIDFLEHFESERIVDEQAGMFEYTIQSELLRMVIFMNVYEDTVFCTLLTTKDEEIVDFGLHNVTKIICDKNKPNVIRFLLYKSDQNYPIVIVYIKPSISLYLDIEQVGAY